MNIAVLGANATAREIARACVDAGEPVHLHADDATAVMDSIDIVERQLDDSDGSAMATGDGVEDPLDKLEGTTGLEAAVTAAEIVIVTAADDVHHLHERFVELESLIEPETILTSAVPGVSVTNAAVGLSHPDRVVGFRFHEGREPFVEVIYAEQTGRDAAARAEQFTERLGVEWTRVRDTPGNVSMRLSLALEVTAIRMVDEGVAGVEAVDSAFRHTYQAERGPLERVDRVGLDTRRDELLSLSQRLDGRFDPPPLLTALVEEGKTGIDAGEGFYNWENGEPTGSALPEPVRPADDGHHRREQQE